MKLLTDNSDEKSTSQKRKCEFEDLNLQSKKCFMNPTIDGADAVQKNLQHKSISEGISTSSTSHCKKYPISSEVIASSAAHTLNVTKRLCLRCLNGESGHWKHVQVLQ